MDIQFNDNHYDMMAGITCRIKTPYGSGTGTILRTDDNDIVYVLTAKHCLLGKDFSGDLQNKEIKIQVQPRSNASFSNISLEQGYRVLFAEDQTLDIAIIRLESGGLKIAHVNALDVRSFRGECFFRGYPQADHSQTGINIPVSFVDNNVLSTQTPLETYDSISHDNCDGFSGSGVFAIVDDVPVLIGLLYELQEPFRRFHIYNVSEINSVLDDNSFPRLSLSTWPCDDNLEQDICNLEQSSSRVLNSINGRFGEKFYLPREDIQPRFDDTLKSKKLVILKGKAGAGKSAFAKNQLSLLSENGYKILAFKADWFAKESIDEIFPDFKHNLHDLLDAFSTTQQLIILIDSLEKLLEVDTYFALKDFLNICRELPQVKLVITCRDYDYQQLISVLHYDFPAYSFVDIPLLSDAELEIAGTHIPVLKDLLEQAQFREILRYPFYLNLVIRHHDIFQHEKPITEADFRKLIWSQIVTKKAPERAHMFETIALERAKRMDLFVYIDGLNLRAVQELVRDGIIEVDENTNESFRSSHDIYEDIALIHYINRVFHDKQNTEDFFVRIGSKSPAMRRGFRLWLNETLATPKNITEFIYDILESQSVERFWVDEVVIAILRSDYCHKFFQCSRPLLLESDQAILLRFIHLLQATCQVPDEQLIQSVQAENDESLYQWIFLKPIGPGWKTVVTFIYEHFDDLLKHTSLILPLIVEDWMKKLRIEHSFPDESEQAGKILVRTLQDIRSCYEIQQNVPYSENLIEASIKALFQMPALFQADIQELITNASAAKRQADERFRLRERSFSFGYSPSIDIDEMTSKYHLRHFNEKTVDTVLSALDGKALCLAMPGLVCQVAREQWLVDDIGGKHNLLFDRSADFGLSESDQNYYPSGIYKTPTRTLLYYHPKHALQLIVDVFNHCIEVYSASDRGQKDGIDRVTLVHADGSQTIQQGNAMLWGIYRGTAGLTSHLLESILMTLEAWLIELCESDNEQARRWLEISYSYFLKKSKSVAVTAVLASVAQAHPHRIGSLCLPILSVREFFKWDMRRYIGESGALSPLDQNIPFAQEERRKSNQLPHRKESLEFLVTRLQVIGYDQEVNQIIDEHQTKCLNNDTDWRLALNRMDARKFAVDGIIESTEGNQIIWRPEIDEDLQDVVEKHRKEFELPNRILAITNWARSAYEDPADTGREIDTWLDAYRACQEIAGSKNSLAAPFSNPLYVAAIGIRDYRSELASEQLGWCIDTVLEILKSNISEAAHGQPSSSLMIKPAIETIPMILEYSDVDEIAIEIKKVISLALLFLGTADWQYPFETFRKSLWEIDSTFAESCLAGTIQFAKVRQQDTQKEHEHFLYRVGLLVDQVISNGVVIDIENIDFTSHSSYYLTRSVQFVPFDTGIPKHEGLLRKIFQLHFDWHHMSKQNPHYDDRVSRSEYDLIVYAAKFTLLQSKQSAKSFFTYVLDHVFNPENKTAYGAVEFVSKYLEQILIEQDSIQSECFWNLWEILAEKIQQSEQKRYISFLLLSHRYRTSQDDIWKSLENHTLDMRRYVQSYGHYDIESVMKLLSGIGMAVLMPQGLNWLHHVLQKVEDPKKELVQSKTYTYAEKLIRHVYYRYSLEVKRDRQCQESLLTLLDLLIDNRSSLAFIVRERLITI